MTFQKQLNHTRELLAKHYLSAAAAGTEGIAYLLGYLKLNGFLRAFASWCGKSLSEWRKEHAEQGSRNQPIMVLCFCDGQCGFLAAY